MFFYKSKSDVGIDLAINGLIINTTTTGTPINKRMIISGSERINKTINKGINIGDNNNNGIANAINKIAPMIIPKIIGQDRGIDNEYSI